MDPTRFPVLVRQVRKADIPCLTSNWLKSYRDAPPSWGIPNSIYFDQHHRVLEELLVRGTVLVLCNEGDTDQILGWVCAEVVDTALVIHYLYVKKPFRRLGLARVLVKALLDAEKPPLVIYTHRTNVAGRILKHRDTEVPWIYNPYLLWTSLPDDWNAAQARAHDDSRTQPHHPPRARSLHSTSRGGPGMLAGEDA